MRHNIDHKQEGAANPPNKEKTLEKRQGVHVVTKERRIWQLLETDEEFKAIGRQLTSSKVEKQENEDVVPNTHICDRLDAIGRGPYAIEGLTATERNFHYDRAFISQCYGGNTQSMFPKIAAKRVKDGIDNLGFLNPEYNPYAPRQPGLPGLFFVINPEWRGKLTKRLFVRIGDAQWMYAGTYEFIPSTPLSSAEFKTLQHSAQATWARNVKKKDWGKPYVARIFLRAQHAGLEPSVESVTDICASKARIDECRKNVTEEQILQEFLQGKESIHVSCLKCVEYDSDWHRSLMRKYPRFLELKEKERQEKSEKRRADHGLAKQRPPKTRQRRGQDPSHRHNTMSKRQLKAAGMDSDESELSDAAGVDSESDDEVADEREVEALMISI